MFAIAGGAGQRWSLMRHQVVNHPGIAHLSETWEKNQCIINCFPVFSATASKKLLNVFAANILYQCNHVVSKRKVNLWLLALNKSNENDIVSLELWWSPAQFSHLYKTWCFVKVELLQEGTQWCDEWRSSLVASLSVTEEREARFQVWWR